MTKEERLAEIRRMVHAPVYWNVPNQEYLAMVDLLAEIDRLRTALTKIAAYDDDSAQHWLTITGSWSRFDEPGSVQIARKALEEEG